MFDEDEDRVRDSLQASFLEVVEHAGSALDRAAAYVEDFQESKIEPLPVIHGALFFQGSIKKKQTLHYFQLQADLGILLRFDNEAAFNKYRQSPSDPFQVTTKKSWFSSKPTMEILYLGKITSVANSFRDEFTKKRGQHCLEMIYDEGDREMFLAAFDSEQIQQWLANIKKAMHFFEWFSHLKEFLEKESDNLTEKFSSKLGEIVQFVEQYS